MTSKGMGYRVILLERYINNCWTIDELDDAFVVVTNRFFRCNDSAFSFLSDLYHERLNKTHPVMRL